MNPAPFHGSFLVRRSRAVLAAALLGTLSGCFGGSGGEHFTRLFRPVLPPSTTLRSRDSAMPVPVTIRRIYGASHLTEQIEWQRGDVEYGYYDELRWIESPARIVERALAEELFEKRGIPAGGGGDEIEVELVAFEQAHSPALRAVVTLEVTRSGKSGNAVRRFEESEPLADEEPETLARAIGLATRRVVDHAADWIERLE